MSLSVEQVRQMREQIKANDAAKTAAQKKTTTQTAKTTPAAATNTKNTGTGLSVAQVAQIRSQMTAAPASTSRLQTTPSTPAWTGGARQVLGTVSADTLGKQVLADMTSDTGSPVATDRQEDYEPDWNYVGSDNAPKQRAIAQGTYGSYAKAAQKVGNALAKDRQTDRFDELNQWMDADPRHREVVNLLRQKEYTTQEDKGVAPEQAVQVTGTKQRYSPGDLLKMGYTAQEINEARAYIREYDALPVTDRAVRRTADTTKGIAATVASAVPMAGEMTAQGVKDIRATQKNEAALDKELEGDARGKELKDRITAVNMDYNPQYTDEDLRGMGYSQSEIDEMRSRIAGTVQKTALDKDTSLGYQLYHYGQQRTEAAQAGMSPAAKTAMGVATSAAENLAVAGVSPYLVLPVLSAQGAAESMGQDVEKGTSAGQAVGVGLAKFGAGWAINSVGVADMARSMGVDYARDTVAGKLADLVRSSKLVSGLGNSQLAANTISGGVDNAVQAFVETYADKIIDATLGGDQQAADELLQSDTFLQALQSGLTGGASGAGRHEPDAGCPGRDGNGCPGAGGHREPGGGCRGSAAGIGRAGHGAGRSCTAAGRPGRRRAADGQCQRCGNNCPEGCSPSGAQREPGGAAAGGRHGGGCPDGQDHQPVYPECSQCGEPRGLCGGVRHGAACHGQRDPESPAHACPAADCRAGHAAGGGGSWHKCREQGSASEEPCRRSAPEHCGKGRGNRGKRAGLQREHEQRHHDGALCGRHGSGADGRPGKPQDYAV